jgi:hypothetical protein
MAPYRALVIVLALVPVACGGGEGPPTAPLIEGSVGGVAIERSDQGDRPLPGRAMHAWVEPEHVDRRLVTDGQGRYQIDRLTPGWRVWLNVDGNVPWSQCALVVTAVAGHLEFDVVTTHDRRPLTPPVPDPPNFRTISGVVYDVTPLGRTPMAGATVVYALTWSAGSAFGTAVVHWTYTDDEGRFRLCGLPQASTGVVIASDPNSETREGRLAVPPGPNTNVEIEIR